MPKDQLVGGMIVSCGRHWPRLEKNTFFKGFSILVIEIAYYNGIYMPLPLATARASGVMRVGCPSGVPKYVHTIIVNPIPTEPNHV